MISIIIPCYNYAQYIGECLLSCYKQTIPAEIVVVDDVSTDESLAVISRFAAEYRPKHFRAIRLRRNSGYSKAKNEGIIASHGEFIVTVDADDMLLPDSLEKRLRHFGDDVDMVDGNAYNFDGQQGYEFAMQRLYKMPIPTGRDKVHAQGVMLRRRVYERYGLYDENLRSRSDNEMWYRLLNIAKIKRIHIEDPVAIYRRHAYSMVERRKRDKPYNDHVTNMLLEAKERRMREGITHHNTRFLCAS